MLKKTSFSFGFLFALLLISNIYAFDSNWKTHFDVSAGYRYDKISTILDIYQPEDNFIFSDELIAKKLKIYEIGFDATLSFCQDWFIKGYYYAGKVYQGHYIERAENDFTEGESTANIHGGNTRDGSIALGYLYPITCGFNLGPIGGWSYHYLRIKVGEVETNDQPDPVLDNLSYSTRWQGPWLGIEGNYSPLCAVLLNFGYEYHWSRWHAKWLLDGPDIFQGSFSDKRHANQAHGQVGFINAFYAWNCFDIGLGLKYQYWKASDGREVPLNGSFEEIGFPDEVDKVRHAAWQSLELTLKLGFNY